MYLLSILSYILLDYIFILSGRYVLAVLSLHAAAVTGRYYVDGLIQLQFFDSFLEQCD